MIRREISPGKIARPCQSVSEGIDGRKVGRGQVLDGRGAMPVLVRRRRLRPGSRPRARPRPTRPARRRRRRGRARPGRGVGLGPGHVFPLGRQGQEGAQAARPQQDHRRQSERGRPKQWIQLTHAKSLSRRTANERFQRSSPPLLHWQASGAADYSGSSPATATSVYPPSAFYSWSQLVALKEPTDFNAACPKASGVEIPSSARRDDDPGGRTPDGWRHVRLKSLGRKAAHSGGPTPSPPGRPPGRLEAGQANCSATNGQLTKFQNISTYLGRRLR